MKRFGSAIIGCGRIHEQHVLSIKKCKYAELRAVMDIERSAAELTAKKHGCKIVESYEEILNDENVDVIHLCTPHYLHASMAIQAMRNNKHVIVEKPMAILIKDASEMIRASKETNMQLGVCFQNRYTSHVVKMKEMLENGQAGKVLGVRAIVTWHRTADYYLNSIWKGKWDTEGGGVLINQAIHTIDLLQWLIGDVAEVKGSIDTRVLNEVIEVEDNAEATIRFENGVLACFYATNCFSTNSPIIIDIVCDKINMRLENDLTLYNNRKYQKINGNSAECGDEIYWGNGHDNLISDYYNCLGSGGKFKLDGEEGIAALKIVYAIYESSKKDKWIKMDNVSI